MHTPPSAVPNDSARPAAEALLHAQLPILERVARGEEPSALIADIVRLVEQQAPELSVTVHESHTVDLLANAHGADMCTPLLGRDGALLGAMLCYRRDQVAPTVAGTAALQPVLDLSAHLLTIVLERQLAERARAAREADQQFLAELTGDLQRTRSLHERGVRALSRLATHLGVPSCGWVTVNAAEGTITVRQEWKSGVSSSPDLVVPLDGWPTFTVDADMVAIHDTATDPRFAATHDDTFATLGHRASLAHGLFRGGAWVGVIYANDTQPREWSAREQQLMRVAADRIWSALDVARALEEADAERRRLQAVLDALPVGVVIADAAGRFVYVNQRVTSIWGGAPHADAVGEYGRYRGWWAHNGKQLASDEWALARALTKGETSTGELIRIARFDGGEAMMLNAAAPIRSEGGSITGAVVIIEDVTEQTRLADLNQQLTEASRRKSAFVSYLSHELRTPLNAILGFTELLHDDVLGPVSDLQREVLVDMLSSGRHLLRLLDDVLDTARIEAGRLELRKGPIDLPTFVDDVMGTMRAAAESARVQLTADIDRDVPGLPFAADPGRLRQVLFNYLANAIKFTARGGSVHLQVTRPRLDTLRFSVSDTGVGISAEHQSRLFLDFEQLDGDSSRGGWGLGLALTRRLVEAHGGAVGVESTPGVGSNFWADYPLSTA